ncbi:heterokaryon incompatibility protein-domain-containing protein [Cadophora sp. MPI-SDFR-AT-0126]|nr:heterokaryon incompatibility protein-domain-containing protein [Leotiomycetes sp. MPI-SDFR-AT-0126]
MSSRLCSSCNIVLTGSQLLKQEYDHHGSRESITTAADQGCYICGIITRSDAWRALGFHAKFKSTWYLEALAGNLAGWFNLTIDAVGMKHDSSDSSERSEEDPMTLELDEIADSDLQKGGQTMIPTSISGPIWRFIIHPATGHQWFSKCRAEHSTCNKQKLEFRPTRLMEILSQNQGRIILTRDIQDEVSSHAYATLSHCWGRAKTLSLLTSNIDQLQLGINIAELPASYQEAIAVCNIFGFQYIWIDSLCIIQDSPGDWRREAMAMKDVYRNSMMNIAAAAAAENTESSFTARDASTISPLSIDIQWEGQEPGKFYLVNADAYKDEVGCSPLRRRAWVVQEVWLSSRNLYLTKNQLWWKCCEREASEAYPEGLPEALSSLGSHTGYGKQRYDAPGLHHTWNRLVEAYSACNLTFPSDKMVAFAGISQHFDTLLGDDAYIAGIWRSQLPYALCWFSTKEYRASRPSSYRAPSWSWPSMDGAIRFGHNPPNAETNSIMAVCSVEVCTISSVDQDIFGSLRGGIIQINGHLTRMGFSHDRIKVEDSNGHLNRIPGADTTAAFYREEHWTLVDMDENTHQGYATCSYLDGVTARDLASGDLMDRSIRKTEPSFAASDHFGHSLFYALPIMKWTEGGSPWIKGLILCLVEIEGICTFQRVGRFTARGSIPISRLMQSPTESVWIL